MIDDNRDKLWTRAFVIICIVSAFVRLSSFMRGVSLPLFIIDLGHQKTQAGLMTSIYAITALVFRPLMGNLIDKKSRRSILLFGNAVFVVTILSFGLYKFFPSSLHSIWVLYLIQVINGIGFSANSVALSTISTDVIPNSRMTEGIGYFGLTSSVTMAFAPSLALFTIDKTGYSNGFLITSGIAFIALILGLMVNYEKVNLLKPKNVCVDTTKEVATDTLVNSSGLLDKIIERNAFIPALIMMLTMFGGSSINTFLPTYARENAIPATGVVFMFQAAGSIVTRLFIGRLADRWGQARVLIVGFISDFFGMLLIFSTSIIISSNIPGAVNLAVAAMLIAGFLTGVSKAFIMTVLNTEAIIRTPMHRRGAANATFYMFMDLGVGLGSVVWGRIADIFGTSWIYAGASVFSVSGMIASTRLRKRMNVQRAVGKVE